MYILETHKLVKKFDNLLAVDALSIKVPKKSVYGILGPNGSGKTTTMKMLVGLSRPTSGSISINGNEMSYGRTNMRNIGYLPDVPNFYSWMKPHELLRFFGQLYALDEKLINERTDYLLELVGLKDNKTRIGGFSLGMKQRLGIAQALMNKPEIVFLDEPTSALDPIGRKDILDLISTLSDEVSIILSSHILSDIERVCDRVLILKHGKMVIEDTIENLKGNYISEFIEIEFSKHAYIAKMSGLLGQLNWVSNFEVYEGRKLRIQVSDLAKAQMEVPKIIASINAPLSRFNLLEPTLEDIFMKVVT